MAYNLLPREREQGYLIPPFLREWLGEDHLAWFIIDAVEQVDLGGFYAAYRSETTFTSAILGTFYQLLSGCKDTSNPGIFICRNIHS